MHPHRLSSRIRPRPSPSVCLDPSAAEHAWDPALVVHARAGTRTIFLPDSYSSRREGGSSECVVVRKCTSRLIGRSRSRQHADLTFLPTSKPIRPYNNYFYFTRRMRIRQVVLRKGVEPLCHEGRRGLRPVRLPIPPPEQTGKDQQERAKRPAGTCKSAGLYEVAGNNP